MTVFAFKPNWKGGFIDRLEWLTNVIRARSGKEQRIRLRETPRRSFEFEVMARRNEYQFLDALLSRMQSSAITVPFWPDKTTLAAPLPVASVVIPVNTVDTDYHLNGLVVIGTDALNTMEGTITAISDSEITIAVETDREWPEGSFIAPARRCMLDASLDVTRPTANVSMGRFRFSVEDDEVAFASAPYGATVLNGTEVFLRKPNRATDVTVRYQRLQEELDFATGIREVADPSNMSTRIRSYSHLLRNRDEIVAFRKWLYERKGQLNPFYAPTWERNIEIVASNNGTGFLKVMNQGHSQFLNGQDGKTNVALRHDNGTWYLRTVSSFGIDPVDSKVERMTMTQAIGTPTVPADWSICSFLELVVLNADAVEITYVTDKVATCNLATRSVKQ